MKSLSQTLTNLGYTFRDSSVADEIELYVDGHMIKSAKQCAIWTWLRESGQISIKGSN